MSQTVSTLTRVLPALPGTLRRSSRMVERSVMVYRRTWMIIVSGFFEPLFYLLSIRIGFGALIGDVTVDGVSIGYAEFVAPALMASAAMNGAVYDSTMNIFYKLKHAKLYDTVLATPLGPTEVAAGEIMWALLRGFLYSVAFLVCITALGMASSPWILLAVPACLLIGFAFAAMGMAITTYMRGWNDFEFIPAATLPMFVFSATFYPLSAYGDWAWIVQVSPLYHGVALVRAAALGDAGWGIVGHVAYLLVMAAIGIRIAGVRLSTLLRT
ncbi:MAG: ABC transporter permease [Actinomycetota bacterium]|jgi:lipooligosaccharide transport system permease protein|nr:ABC transporter permease [Actinomycetota bacterium]MDA3015662.1 ABC transporter permease [Actinomycetota bacterium]MDA3027448.1 ABC transporter permease [Actinomycetota bacterium]